MLWSLAWNFVGLRQNRRKRKKGGEGGDGGGFIGGPGLENGLRFHADSMMDGGGGVGLGQDTGSRWREKLTRGPQTSAGERRGGA
jgi:hypothetical protein